MIIAIAASAYLRLSIPEQLPFDLGNADQKTQQLQSVQILIASLAFFTPLGMVGILVIPLLMVQEKELGTLRFLIVSPASMTEVLIGKTIVGVIFGMLIGVVAVAIVYDAVNLLSLTVLLAVFAGSVLFTCLGLLTSAFVRTSLQLNTWSLLPLLFLLAGLAPEGLGAGLTDFLKLIPSYSASVFLRGSLQGGLAADALIVHIFYLSMWTVALFALSAWLYCRTDNRV